MSERAWSLYLLACAGGRVYAGIALDVEARFRLHQQGRAAKFTRAFRPIEVLAVQEFSSKSEALRAEHALKNLSKSKKLEWARRWRVL